MTMESRIVRALAREGGRASAATLGRATGRGHRVNSCLASMEARGLVRRTGKKDGRSPIWELVSKDE